MITKTQILAAAGSLIAFGGIGTVAGAMLTPTAAPAVTLTNPQKIVWNKPTTDVGWAEDVKQENFDLKSSDVLQEMKISLTQSLTQQQEEFTEYTDCPPCIFYEHKQDLHKNYPNLSDSELSNEAQNAATTDTNIRQFGIEKTQQSIERIDHELDLRARGIVVPNLEDRKGTPTPKLVIEKVTPNMIRHIND